MRRVLAIARLAVAGAVRSRVVLTLVMLLLLAVVALPLTIKGDGTEVGRVHILLSYTLGFAFALLAIATVWAGCAAISMEIQERQAHLLLTKPVSCFQLWLGKWLGITFLNGTLLLASVLTVYGLLRWNLAREAAGEGGTTLRATHLAAHVPCYPVTSHLDEATEAQLHAALAEGQVPDQVDTEALRASLRTAILRRYFTVGPEDTRAWRFNVPAELAGHQPAKLRFKFAASSPGPQTVKGAWEVGPPELPAAFVTRGEYAAGQWHTLTLPPEALGRGGELRVAYDASSEQGLSALFAPEKGLELMVYEASFEVNLLRAYLLMLFRLALLAALGVTAGALLSTPVALFTTCALAFLLQFSGYVERMAAQEIIFQSHDHAHAAHAQEPGAMDQIFRQAFATLDLALRPLRDPPLLDHLAGGRTLPWRVVAHGFVSKLVCYAGLLALGGSFFMRRREIGLPS